MTSADAARRVPNNRRARRPCLPTVAARRGTCGARGSMGDCLMDARGTRDAAARAGPTSILMPRRFQRVLFRMASWYEGSRNWDIYID